MSIIVVNWNGEQLIDECLKALFCQTYPHYEVIFVDNGSADFSVSRVRQHFPQAKVVELSTNTGFSGGNQAGARIARGEFLALVNNDARPDKAWLQNLLKPMLEDERVGFCSSKIVIEATAKINSAGGAITSSGVGYDRGLGEATGQYNHSEFVFGACAAAALYRRKMLDEIGFLDEDFFLYCEDVDLSFRAQLAGWKCVYVPTAIVSHKWQATAGRLSDLHVYYHNRNLEFVWIKNMPAKLMLRYAHHKIGQELMDIFGYCIRRGKWRPFLRAKLDAIRMVPIMLKKRAAIQRTKKVSDDYIASLLTPIFSETFRKHKRLARLVSAF
ncbi:MAG TPA: glycosyltransferase family 2 protein [Candidatus Acidoferrales bacterium]|nr:glycosyltransferase family 2 protein [Candidatus Acidoferrales bacterium]